MTPKPWLPLSATASSPRRSKKFCAHPLSPTRKERKTSRRDSRKRGTAIPVVRSTDTAKQTLTSELYPNPDDWHVIPVGSPPSSNSIRQPFANESPERRSSLSLPLHKPTRVTPERGTPPSILDFAEPVSSSRRDVTSNTDGDAGESRDSLMRLTYISIFRQV